MERKINCFIQNLYFFYRSFLYGNGFGSNLCRTFLYHLCHTMLLIGIDYRHATAQDTGLLPGNIRKFISQILHMIIAYGSEDTQFFILYHIGGIQPAPKPGLQNHILHAPLFKEQHGHKEQPFKKRGMIGYLLQFLRKIVQTVLHPAKGFHKLFLGYYFSFYHKPFPHGHKMRRDKHAAGNACFL